MLGTAFLLIAVVGSGIAGERLAAGLNRAPPRDTVEPQETNSNPVAQDGPEGQITRQRLAPGHEPDCERQCSPTCQYLAGCGGSAATTG
jgi:hypothetical protein